MHVAIAADHAGLGLKNALLPVLERAGHTILDLGAHVFDAADDYPDFAFAVADAVAGGRAERGIVLCGSGVGACIAANKVRGVRASICHDLYSARQGVEHDDMNVLCLGSKIVSGELAESLARAFLGAEFQPEERFIRRRTKVTAREEVGR
jgi:ribose 5-phosphate isomerase B